MTTANTQDVNGEAPVRCSAWLGAGDLVITRIKNRWGLECAGTVESVNGDTADVRVWNMNGPGADMLVTGIPTSELTKSA
jgi:hypothetical protein